MVMAPVKDWIYYKLIQLQLSKMGRRAYTKNIILDEESKEGYLTKKRKITGNILKPLFNCPVCMSSIYGSAYYWVEIRQGVIEWLVYLVMLSGLIFTVMLIAYNDPRG